MSESGPGGPSSDSTDDGKSVCPECGDSFDSKMGLKIHYSKIHNGNLGNGGYECPSCGRGLSSRKSKRQHMRSCCPEDMVECPTCSRLLRTELGLKLHHAREHGESLVEVTKTCDYCGDEDTRKYDRGADNTFCSPSCRDKFFSERDTKDHPQYKPKVEVECYYCESITEKPPSLIRKGYKSFCDQDCYGQHVSETRTGEDHPNYAGGSVTYYGPNWDEQSEKARERDNHQCQYCEKDQSDHWRKLPVHHMKRIKWFKENYDAPEWWQKGNRLDNLVTYCESCHNDWEGIPLRPELV